MDATQVLSEINQKAGTNWEIDSQLAGGLLAGAWKIRDKSHHAVLKLHDPASTVPYNPDASRLVEQIRQQGYPTPKWLATGVTKSGINYAIQELAPGKSLPKLDTEAANIIIDLVKLQRKIKMETDLNWSKYMRDHVMLEHPSHTRLTTAGGVVSEALQKSLNLAAPYVDSQLVEHEMVHGDLSLSNIMVDDGRLSGVVDIWALGRGCAVYDILAAALNGVIWDADPAAIQLLHDFALDTYGPGPMAIASATLVIEGLIWRLDGSSIVPIEKAAQKSIDWLSQIKAIVSRD